MSRWSANRGGAKDRLRAIDQPRSNARIKQYFSTRDAAKAGVQHTAPATVGSPLSQATTIMNARCKVGMRSALGVLREWRQRNTLAG
jgi:hypothetical protein